MDFCKNEEVHVVSKQSFESVISVHTFTVSHALRRRHLLISESSIRQVIGQKFCLSVSVGTINLLSLTKDTECL